MAGDTRLWQGDETQAGAAQMNIFEIIFTVIGAVIIALVLWRIIRNGTVPPTLDVDPDDRYSSGA